MTQPHDLAAHHVQQYERAAAAQTQLAIRYLTEQDPPELSLAATACHRALQFERQAQALTELQKDLQSGLQL